MSSTSRRPNIPKRKLNLVTTICLLPLCQKSAPLESRGVGQQGVRHTEPLLLDNTPVGLDTVQVNSGINEIWSLLS